MGLLDIAKSVGAAAQRYQAAEAVRTGRAAPSTTPPQLRGGLLGSVAGFADRYQRAENARIRGVPLSFPSPSPTPLAEEHDRSESWAAPLLNTAIRLPDQPNLPGPPPPMRWDSAEPVDLSFEWLNPIISSRSRRSF